MRYTNVKNLQGGFKAWGEAGYSIFNRHGEFKMIAFEKKEWSILSLFNFDQTA